MLKFTARDFFVFYKDIYYFINIRYNNDNKS